MAQKDTTPPKRESPVQFRMEGDLGRHVRGFAERHTLGVNEAAKSLIALAVVGLDCRYYDLVRQLGDTLGGSTPFTRACLHLHASLEGAAVATGQTFIPEHERPGLVLRIVAASLADRGRTVKTEGLWFMGGTVVPTVATETTEDASAESDDGKVKVDIAARKKRTIRKYAE